MVAGPEHEKVAFAEADTLCLLGGLELRAADSCAGLEPGHATKAGDVEQHTPQTTPCAYSVMSRASAPAVVTSPAGRPL